MTTLGIVAGVVGVLAAVLCLALRSWGHRWRWLALLVFNAVMLVVNACAPLPAQKVADGTSPYQPTEWRFTEGVRCYTNANGSAISCVVVAVRS